MAIKVVGTCRMYGGIVSEEDYVCACEGDYIRVYVYICMYVCSLTCTKLMPL